MRPALNDSGNKPSRLRAALWKARAKIFGPGIARNVEQTNFDRWCLLMVRVAPFRMPSMPATHQNEWQVREMARALSGNGFNVDVVDFNERRPLLHRDYDLVIDLHPRSNPIYADRLAPGARRISYMTGSNPTFSNAAERARLAGVRERRGVTLRPRRQATPFPVPLFESFDSMVTFAGKAALSTYSEFRLPPVHHIVNGGYDDVSPTDPDLRDPRRFLFLASVGQVHKGLDLLLEIFAGERDLTLVVCSMFAREPDFTRAYEKELYRTPNVRAAGFKDIKSAEFRELQAGCGAMILPSCSEAQCGSVTVAMSFGIPCIVSRECDYDEPEIETLRDCSLETIRDTVQEWAALPRPLLRERSERSLELMRRKYTPGDYARTIREALGRIL
jgi:glycosyltransferase involved in cell wall biosynthesis